jgi:hypothetical protein
MNQNEVNINGQIFWHVKTRLHSPVSIYGNEDFFVRIGPEELIKRELALHKSLVGMDFPVAKIVSEGWLDNEHYYIEESLWEEILWKKFCLDFKENSEISEENFEHFIAVVHRYAIAQANIVNKGRIGTLDFLSWIQIEELIKEAPGLTEITKEAIAKSAKRLSAFPLVFSQWDLNPHNILEKGVIDFDMGFEAPYWYDLVTAIYHTYTFPPKGIAEYSRWYVFSGNQERVYLEMIDNVSNQAWFPKISDLIPDFLIGRLVWSVVRMHDCPLLQKWRYEKFEAIIKQYLNDEDGMILYKS